MRKKGIKRFYYSDYRVQQTAISLEIEVRKWENKMAYACEVSGHKFNVTNIERLWNFIEVGYSILKRGKR